MSTPAPSSPSLHPTRRQLDELDALMERMLELPVNPDGEANQPTSEEPAISASADASPFSEFSPHGIASYQTEEGAGAVTAARGEFSFGSSSSGTETGIPAIPASPQARMPNRGSKIEKAAASGRDPQSSILDPRRSHAGGTAGDEPPPSLWTWPVVGINRIYDTLMSGLGTPGRMMRGAGRAWLGWIGLLMLAAALAWGVFDWLQWAG